MRLITNFSLYPTTFSFLIFLFIHLIFTIYLKLHRIIYKSLRNLEIGCTTTKTDTAKRSTSIG
jgi:hypothetical protein